MDAFIIALEGVNRVSLENAEVLEKEWGNISLSGDEFRIQSDINTGEPQEPPTLVYRVEVMRSEKELSGDDLDSIREVAGSRKFDIYKSDDDQYVYLIGNFLTFESAGTYSDLLYRNGMREAKVVAYLGKKEIPLETARQLFEMYFNK